nr:hypothetical protein [Tanacetum cinerariifolium]
MDKGDKEATKQDLVAKVVMEVLGRLPSDMMALAYLRLSLGHGSSTRINVVVKICPEGTTMVDVSLKEGRNGFPTKLNVLPMGFDPRALVELTLPVEGNIVFLQMDDDDKIFNLVDLHVYMLCGGWKWKDLLRLALVDHH